MSPKYTLSGKDFKSILVTLVIVALSAVVAQLLVIVPFLDLGKNTALYTLILVTVLKSAQKFLDGEKQSLPEQPVQ